AEDAYPYDEHRSEVAVVQVPSLINAVDYIDALDSDGGESRYRGADGVDIENDATAGLHIGRMSKGEWLRYAINVAQAGYYDVTLSLGSKGASTLALEVEGQRSTTLDFQTGAGRDFQPFTIPTVYLPAGKQTLTVSATEGSFRFANMTFNARSPELAPLLHLSFEDVDNLTFDSSSHAREDVTQLGQYDQAIMRTGRGLQFVGDQTQKLVLKNGPALGDFSVSVQTSDLDITRGKISLAAINESQRGFLLLEKTAKGELRIRSLVYGEDGAELKRHHWSIKKGESAEGFITLTFASVSRDEYSSIGDVSIYLDGELIVHEVNVRLPHFDTSQMVLGDGSGSLTKFYSLGQGQLDEWRVDSHALSASQVAAIYAASAAPDSDDDGHIDLIDAFPNDPHEWL
ncbi:carbohydrate-binding protein, partial [Vibrio nomapromontoriensis]|uniref:carbohydrate-binding protein n=1 Tax=Vibrio nomapromontoriensis TaxID=2910246 RepID=UPI003D0BDE6C